MFRKRYPLVCAVWFFLFCAFLETAALAAPSSAGVLDDLAIWDGSFDKGWKRVSIGPKRVVWQMQTPPKVFGFKPVKVQAVVDEGKVRQLYLLLFEVAEFFGGARVGDMEGNVSNATKNQLRVAYNSVADGMTKQLADWTGAKGEKVTVGRSGPLQAPALEYTKDGHVLRLTCVREQLVSLIVLRDADAEGPEKPTPQQLRDSAVNNVERRANGDVIVTGIPMVDQGEKGYCMMASLSMVAQYWQSEMDMDFLAAKSGYKYGDTPVDRKAIPIYHATGREAGLDVTYTDGFNYDRFKEAIDRGQPVIAFRFIRAARDKLHMKYAAEVAKNPDATAPDGFSDRDQFSTRTFRDGGHASVINGYNDQRKEIIFTDSWGEGHRNKRMSVEEMRGSCMNTFYIGPEESKGR